MRPKPRNQSVSTVGVNWQDTDQTVQSRIFMIRYFFVNISVLTVIIITWENPYYGINARTDILSDQGVHF